MFALLLLISASPAGAAAVEDLAVILPKGVRTVRGYPWQYGAQTQTVSGPREEAPARILRATLDREARQRGFFVELPSYRLEFALESLRDAFGVRDYMGWKAAVLEKNKKPGLVFSLNWTIAPKGEAGRQAFEKMMASGSMWSESLLQWEQLPEGEAEFVESLRTQLSEQYFAITRRRVIEEATSQQLPECLQNAMMPSPRAMAVEYSGHAKDFERQQTRIGFAVVRGVEGELRRLLDVSAELQKPVFAGLTAGGKSPARSEIHAARSRILSELKARFPGLQWRDATVLWPELGPSYPAQTGGLTPEQLGFALKAPLGTVLIPNTLEKSGTPEVWPEVWMVTGEARDAVVTLPLADPSVQAVLQNKLKVRAYVDCATRWFERELGTSVQLASGLKVERGAWTRAIQEVLQ